MIQSSCLPSLINATWPNALCKNHAVACDPLHHEHHQPSTLFFIHHVQAVPLDPLNLPVHALAKRKWQTPQSKPRPWRPGMSSCAWTPCVDAALPHRCTPPPASIACTHDHLTAPYSLDTLAGSRVNCTCLWTTPPAAMDADALHGHATTPNAPILQLTCQHARPDPLAR